MSGNVLDIPCTLEIEQTADSFHAHLVLDGDIAIYPGDRVLVHGEPVRMAFGEKLSERRRVTLTLRRPAAPGLDAVCRQICASGPL